ncbi:MAG: histone deacetylase family protein [Pseudomonadota bacterium]
MTTAFITHPLFSQHDGHAGHPECSARLDAIVRALEQRELMSTLVQYDAPRAPVEQVLRAHTAQLLDELERTSPTSGIAHIDADTFMNSFSLEAAWHAAGAVLLATELVATRRVHNAFCAVRPPGHHAERHRAMGFCLINSVAVGAYAALEDHGYERVAVVDFDVHHGNGTENILAGDDRILFCSTFQHPFYPYDGADTKVDNIVNTPLPAGTSSAEFRAAIERDWLPALIEFHPDILFISAGFDAHSEDPLAQFDLKDEDYTWVTDQLLTVADRCCGGRIVSSLEGGYALGALSRCAALHISRLLTNVAKAH